ncbi:MAG: hypothetical protein KIT57_21195 [Blastocatellales bacterium]|nr:hypothetical protein [Blastocatellales bacterium]
MTTAYVKISIASNPKRFLQTSVDDNGAFALPVPPETINIEVGAKGYKLYKVDGQYRFPEKVKVKVGDTRRVKMYLRAMK